MTEDEAKTKWCPMVRMLDYGHRTDGIVAFGACNVFDGEKEQRTTCIGSACMLWRWDVVPEIVGGGNNWDGHCGLASMQNPIVGGPTVPMAIFRGKMGEPIGKGVYSNPQPGDSDHGK